MSVGHGSTPSRLIGVARTAAGATAMPHNNGIAARAAPRSDDAAHGARLAVMRMAGSTLRRRSMSLHREAVALRFAASDARGAYGGGAGSASHSGLALAGGARIHCDLAGSVGNSMAYPLARLGWRDIVLLDKGPLPNPGGSTGHASNFIFLTDHSKEMTQFTADSVRQYQELGVFTQSGGIEVARTAARMEDLKRRLASSKSWGIESELVTPAQVKAMVPYIEGSVILGGFSTPGVGVVDSLRAGTLMREAAQARGALTISAQTEITGIDVRDGRVRSVRTDRGDIEAETVVICCGVWSPRIARMAGASIPLTPAVHQMISVGPVPLFADTVGEIRYPIVRDMDTNMYERQHGGDLEGGAYAHRPILMEADAIPSIAESALSPTELPFTKEDFDLQMEQALELVPGILGGA